MKITLAEIKERFPEFEFKHYSPTTFFSTYSHDSRDMVKDSLYIPIIGDKYDGHQFIEDALENGASVSLCENSKQEHIRNTSKPVILVDTIQEGLEKILNYSISNITAPIVAICGSNGKTTTRRLLTHILNREKKVLSSEKTNTVWGNSSLLSHYNGEDIVILECATSSKKEISWHVNSTDPDIGILLNIDYVYSKELGGLEGIYQENKDLADYMEKTGKPLIINIDDEYLSQIPLHYNKNCPIYTFGMDEKAMYRIKDTYIDENGTHFSFINGKIERKVHLPMYGEGYVYDALCAIIASKLLGIETDEAILYIESFPSTESRFDILQINDNLTIVNDSFSCSPQSLKMSLSTFNKLYGGKGLYTIAIIGDSMDLEGMSDSTRDKMKKQLLDINFNEYFIIGENSKEYDFGTHTTSLDEITTALSSLLKKHDKDRIVLYIKGSHSVGLYKLIDYMHKLNAV